MTYLDKNELSLLTEEIESILNVPVAENVRRELLYTLATDEAMKLWLESKGFSLPSHAEAALLFDAVSEHAHQLNKALKCLSEHSYM